MIHIFFILAACVFILFCLFAIFYNLQTFPQPTGPFDVGVIDLPAIDEKRKEPNAPDGARELMLHIWYPISKNNRTSKPSTIYDNDALENTKKFMSKKSGLPAWCFAGLNGTKIYEIPNAVIADAKQYPIIIMSHGAGPMIQDYTLLGEELASHGYIVIGINHPYMAPITRYSDDRIIYGLLGQKKQEGKHISDAWKKEQREVFVEDIEFVLDYLQHMQNDSSSKLYNRLDLARIGICGHSFGGTVSMQICQRDKRIKAGVCMDQGFKGNDASAQLLVPVLNIMAEKSHAWRGERGVQEQQELIELSKKQNSNLQLVLIKNVGHAVFLDFAALIHTTFFTQLLSYFVNIDVGASSSKALKAIKVIKLEIVKFFDQQLRA